MLYFAYLDEFGHIGPYIAHTHPQHNTSPVFGLGGIVLPYHQVRSFATWFYQLKCQLLDYEIKRSKKHPATWEKKGAALYTTRNVGKYPAVKQATNRILNKLQKIEGVVFYTGLQKTLPPDRFNPKGLYISTLRSAMKELNAFAASREAKIIIVMDQLRAALERCATEAAG